MSEMAIFRQLMRKMEAVLKSRNFFLRNCRLAGLLSIFLVLAIILVSGTTVPEPWTINPGGASGAITASTTRKDLVARYGAANVRDQDVDIGEGETEPGTAVFPRDPKRSIEILWKDPKTKRSPKSLTVRGSASLWKTVHEITLGTSLKKLEQINGRPFELFGFEWDYSGTVSSWQNGVLDKDLVANGRVTLRLNPSEHTPQADVDQAAGEGPFASNQPVMQKINPCVYEISWEFP